ncbi:ATP synthase subunit b [Spirochaetota bacterium]|nr:ATP synthase subunit b [Spirochaetota bacterium]
MTSTNILIEGNSMNSFVSGATFEPEDLIVSSDILLQDSSLVSPFGDTSITTAVQHSHSTGQPQIYLAAADSSSGGNPFLKADPGLVLWTWIVFVLTLLTLYKFAWKPILKMLDEREQRINDALVTAEKTEENAKQTAAASEKILAEARATGQSLIDQARQNAETLKAKMEQETKNNLKTMTDKAEAAIEAKQEQAKTELKNYVTTLSFAIAEKLIEENIDPNKNDHLVKKYLNELK